VIGPAMLAKHFAPRLNKGGSIVLLSGVNAFKINVGYLGVAVTNGAVDFLTRSLAVEWGPKVRLNCIALGTIQTEALDEVIGDEERHCTGGQAQRDGQRAADPEPLLGEFERNARDEGTGAEAEHQPDEALVPAVGHTGQGADDQRGGGDQAHSSAVTTP